MRLQAIHQGDFRQCLLIPAFGGFLLFQTPLLNTVDVGENQFGVDDLDIPNRVHRVHHVFDIRVFKAADHLHDGVHLADVPQELIAQAFARAGALHQTGDIHEFENGRNQLLRTADFREHFETFVGNRDDALIRLDGAKTVVGRHRLARLRDSIEQSAFPDVGKTYDSGA